jgi:hypothetical protein
MIAKLPTPKMQGGIDGWSQPIYVLLILFDAILKKSEPRPNNGETSI